MRFYSKKIIGDRMKRQAESKVETRNAVVQAIYPDDRYALVRIQGSGTDIVAHYPLSFQSTPSWLKIKTPVIIGHTGGIRSRIELVGPGLFVPTAQAGETPPTIPGGSDCILTGCKVRAMATPTLQVYVTAGTYRINAITYTLAADTSPIAIDAAPAAGYFRYDYLVIGIDGTVDYVKGTAFTTTESFPDVPADHIKCGHILFSHQDTVVTQEMIDKMWTAPVVSQLVMVITDDELEWDELTTDVAVYVQDQYGGSILPDVEWEVTMSFLTGNGEIDGVAPPGTVPKTTATDHVHFTYERNHLPTDASPTLLATLTSTKSITVTGQITLLDQNGDPMGGGGAQSSVNDLTSASIVTINWSKYKTQRIILAHDVVFAFTGAVDGDRLLLVITQDDSSARTVTLPDNVRYSDDLPDWTMTTDLGYRDYLGFFYDGLLDVYDLEAINQGFPPYVGS